MGKNEAFGERWVAVQPKGDEGGRIGIRKINFAEHLECVSGDFRGIGHDAMDDFEAVYVGGMFVHATEAVDDGRGEKGQNLQQ